MSDKDPLNCPTIHGFHPLTMTTKDCTHFDTLLDTQGLYCPEPVMMLHGAIAEVSAGQVVKVIATDPSTQRDIPKFCDFLGHTLLLQHQENGVFEFYIQSQGHQ